MRDWLILAGLGVLAVIAAVLTRGKRKPPFDGGQYDSTIEE